MPPKSQLRYRDAGVDIDAADRAVSSIKKLARRTFTPGVLGDIGSFGALYQISGWRRPVLVSSADGVGTKLKIAFLTGRHDTVGEDLVNHCVNDIAVQGARPLFFLDYFAVGKLDADVAAAVVSGIARGCRANGCALIGGETAEMPGLYAEAEYDLAGFIVGAAERGRLLTGSKIRVGDALLALPSTGLHTNGYSLARKLLLDVAGYGPRTLLPEVGASVGDALLAVHRSYLKPLSALLDAGLLRGAAHITGGGITDNTPRMLPAGLAAAIDTTSWRIPPLFEVLKQIGNLPEDDYRRTFNLGVGMIFAVPARAAARAEKLLAGLGEKPFRIGEVIAQKRGRPAPGVPVSRLGILISGRGSNFEAIADNVAAGSIPAEIAVVISSRPSAPGLEAARRRGLEAVSIPSRGHDREIYDGMLIDELRRRQVDLVCLAGFMRLLSARFIREFPGRILNIHPSLLPAFPGLDAQQQALEHGVRITGCTVHFVDEQLDAGPIILQAAVAVRDDDDT